MINRKRCLTLIGLLLLIDIFFFLEFCKTASYSNGWIWYGSIQTMNFQSWEISKSMINRIDWGCVRMIYKYIWHKTSSVIISAAYYISVRHWSLFDALHASHFDDCVYIYMCRCAIIIIIITDDYYVLGWYVIRWMAE